MIDFKHSLVMVDIDRQIRRLEITSRNPEGEIRLLQCPLSNKACSVNCVAISLYETNDFLGLACKALPRTILLGILDPETISLDLVDALKNANTIMETK